MKLFIAKFTPWIFDVRIWILFLFLARLENINLPPLDEHDWRQTITLGVARDFIEVNPNLFEPRTVICDSREGIQAQEFPFFNYCISGLWLVFGQQNWCYRLFNLLVSSIGLFYFSKIVRGLTDERTALASTVLFGVSVAYMYARKGMPDVFAVSLVLIGVEFGYSYLEQKKVGQFIWFVCFTSLGLLCKMPAACAMGLLAPAFISKTGDPKFKLRLLFGAMGAVMTMALWYFIWVPWAEVKYKFPLFFPASLKVGLAQLISMKSETISRFYPVALTSRIAFWFCLMGLGYMIYRKNKTLWLAFGASTLLIIALMLKAGGTFSGHVYYIIPYVPMMALLAGYGINQLIKNQWIVFLVIVVITTEALVFHHRDFFIPDKNKKYLKLEKITDQYVPKTSRILVNNGEGSPVMMYFAHRRGWTVTDKMKETDWIKGEATVGMDYLVIERSRWNDTLQFPRLFEDNDFQIYKTTSK